MHGAAVKKNIENQFVRKIYKKEKKIKKLFFTFLQKVIH